ncbi:CZB domain-containing protein [Sulfurimonas sp. C5]|uniref:CZB domain-containing protein n=1 Tax=Sulfurimonas sp. C5 TaxID=3036947 RepID=UPI002456BEB3|nr:CZB domain-containing protein [Sulfurimonas sp. C5]MDH4944622.1 CZB domain-containing protein [Sulfurimonas sp. C5]
MKKNEMLEAIALAKETHQRQMDKIKQIIKGKDVEEPTALGKMECECGQWFYSNKDTMTQILGHQLFERLDKIHEQWHKDYARVYQIHQKLQKKKTSLLSKVFNGSISSLDADKLKLYYKELSQITDDMFREADTALRRVAALPDSKFK